MGSILEFMAKSMPFTIFILILTVGSLALFIRQLGKDIASINKDMKSIKEDVIWKDTFDVYKEGIEARLTLLEK